jgi:TM2 domain-containing membrane protein YozV
MLDPTSAGVLSLFLPGLGQLATGRPGRAIYFAVLALIVWTISFALFGWVVHICAALDAWYRAQQALNPAPVLEPIPVNLPHNVYPFPQSR